MFNSNQDLREFASTLCEELNRNNEYELANELQKWNELAFTSSTEFLGELMLILEKVYEISTLSDRKQQISEILPLIKKAIG